MAELSAISDKEILFSSSAFSIFLTSLPFSEIVFSFSSRDSLFFLSIHHTKKVKPEPIRNKVLGIPGINPKRNSTHALGNHACLTPICEPICLERSWLVETLVTIIAVAIASKRDGI